MTPIRGIALMALVLIVFAFSIGSLSNRAKLDTLVEVKIVYIKPEHEGGWHETFPHTIVERTDTRERIMIRGYTWGNTNDVFKIKNQDLKW